MPDDVSETKQPAVGMDDSRSAMSPVLLSSSSKNMTNTKFSVTELQEILFKKEDEISNMSMKYRLCSNGLVTLRFHLIAYLSWLFIDLPTQS